MQSGNSPREVPFRSIAEAPRKQEKPGGEKQTPAAQKHAGLVKKISLECPGFPQARWNFHLIWRNFHLAWRKFHLAWRNFHLAWRLAECFSLCGVIFALPGGMFACLAEFLPGLVSFSPGLVGFLLFTWPGGLLIELIALHPAWHWRRSALYAMRPSLNIQTAA